MKKRCGIITFSQAINYGAVLQMYALQQFITKEIGGDCEIIDYYSSLLAKEYDKPCIKRLLNPKVLASVIIKNSYTRYNFKGFSEFNQKYIRFSKDQYRSTDELKKTNKIYDCFIVGSDQVFNMYCNHFDDNFFLDFVDDEHKKYSYAASVGLQKIPDHLRKRYAKVLSKFKEISVRESSSVKILEEITGKNVNVSVDPTLLLTETDWKKLFSEELVSGKNKKPYILIYGIIEDKRMLRLAHYIAKKEGYDILYINDRLMKPRGMKSLMNVGPIQWLSLVYGAKLVITNSYHGILFSCNFKKNFYPFLLQKNTQVNSRVSDFLKKYGLADLIVDEHCSEKDIEFHENIDFSVYDTKINQDIEKSRLYLFQIFEE